MLTGQTGLRAKLYLIVATILISSVIVPSVITGVQAADCPPNCNLEVITDVPLGEAMVWVRVDGSTFSPLNNTFQFPYNTTGHTIEVMNTTFFGAVTGARYVFKQWSYNGIPWACQYDCPTLQGNPFPLTDNFTATDNHPFRVEFERQFQASFSFTDPSGQPISPPRSITLQGPSSRCPDGGISLCILSNYSNRWLSAAVWTVTDATWQSMPNMVDGIQTVDLRSGSVSTQIRLRAYTATVRVVDRSNSPIPGVSLFVRLTNQTTIELPFTTDSQGQVQLGHIPWGSYTVRLVYQNQNSTWPLDASQAAVSTIQLDVGGTTSGPIISAVVLMTIFGVAMFLLLLAVKVRKPPLPPTI